MGKKKSGIANAASELKLGGGAQFWAYISPQKNTAELITNWEVIISQGNWTDSISSQNPTKQIQTPPFHPSPTSRFGSAFYDTAFLPKSLNACANVYAEK